MEEQLFTSHEEVDEGVSNEIRQLGTSSHDQTLSRFSFGLVFTNTQLHSTAVSSNSATCGLSTSLLSCDAPVPNSPTSRKKQKNKKKLAQLREKTKAKKRARQVQSVEHTQLQNVIQVLPQTGVSEETLNRKQRKLKRLLEKKIEKKPT